MSNASDVVLIFVREQLEAKAAGFVLGRDTEQGMSIVARADAKDSAEEIARRFIARAESFADAAPGHVCAFLVASLNEHDRHLEMQPFTCGGDEIVAPSIGLGNQDIGGMTARASLRHMEKRELAQQEALADLISNLREENKAKTKRIEQLERQNDELRAKYWEQLEAGEMLLSRAKEREIMEEKAKAEEESRQFLWSTLSKLAPVAIATMTGSTKLAKFVKSLDAGEMKALAQAMGTESRTQMQELLTLAQNAETSAKQLAEGA